MPSKNKNWFFKNQLRQNTSINLDVLPINIILKVTLVEQINNNKMNNKEELGAN